MHIKSEEDCLKAIDEWGKHSPSAQIRNLNKAIETLELDQMYYRDKGSAKPVERCDRCLEILNKRLSEISSE